MVCVPCMCCHSACIRLDHLEVYIPPKTVAVAKRLPHTMVSNQSHQSYHGSLLRSLVRDISIDGTRVRIWSDEGHGRLGRVYALTHPRHVVKVSKTELEAHAYSVLQSRNIPCAHVVESRDVRIDNEVYSVTVMTRLDFTVTALVRAAGLTKRRPKGLDDALQDLIEMLTRENVAYIDLSPDNIMFSRVHGKKHTYRIHLIDPQFVVSLDEFERVSRWRDYDCMYIACKLVVLGALHEPSRKFAYSLCRSLLGYVPSHESVYDFLSRRAPRAVSVVDQLRHTVDASGHTGDSVHA